MFLLEQSDTISDNKRTVNVLDGQRKDYFIFFKIKSNLKNN